MKIIIKNRRNNKEEQILTLEEFKTKFSKELETAVQIYSRDKQYKDSLKPPYIASQSDYKADFYQDLRWNFNNNAQSVYYIDKIE